MNKQKIPTKWYQKLIHLCTVQSYSKNEKFMVMYLIEEIEKLGLEWEIDKPGNILVTKGKAKTYPCIVSHMDTVHTLVNNYSVWSTNDKNKLFAKSGKSLTGIGGDDKCGIFACLYFLNILPSVKIVFFTQEESGCYGSNNIDLNFFSNCRYIIELDRRGNDDFIDKKCGNKTVSHTFSSEVGELKKEYKFKSTEGTYTDVITLYNRNVNISVVNISSGYYLPHSNNEYIIVSELWNSILFTKELISKLKSKRYEHKKAKIETTYKSKHKYIKCEICKTIKSEWVLEKYDGKYYCWTCRSTSKDFFKCEKCNRYDKTNKMIYADGGLLCRKCAKGEEDEIGAVAYCEICNKEKDIKYGKFHGKEFICTMCYNTLSNFEACSICKLSKLKICGEYDGEIFTCRDCLDKDNETTDIVKVSCETCSICYVAKPITSGVYTGRDLEDEYLSDMPKSEFICNECIANNHAEKCDVCGLLTSTYDGIYISCIPKEFVCFGCQHEQTIKDIQSSQKKQKE